MPYCDAVHVITGGYTLIIAGGIVFPFVAFPDSD